MGCSTEVRLDNNAIEYCCNSSVSVLVSVACERSLRLTTRRCVCTDFRSDYYPCEFDKAY